jgi:hypothetical protein
VPALPRKVASKKSNPRILIGIRLPSKNWQIETGMTSEMVQAALGKPDSVSGEGGEEVWGFAMWVVTYARHYKRIVYLVYFKDDKVIRTKGDVNRIRQLF